MWLNKLFRNKAILFTIVILSAFAAEAAAAITIIAGQDYYTSEDNGQLLVRAELPQGKEITASVDYEGKTIASGALKKIGKGLLMEFPVGVLPEGESELLCRLLSGREELASEKVTIKKLAPKPYAVKIDYITGGLIVDDKPFFPFGFYCNMDAIWLAEEEIHSAFNVISPYWSVRRERPRGEIEKIRAFLNRCAEIGMKVNYHMSELTLIPPAQKEKMFELLRHEVEAFRDHPAVLSWYISDEPGGQGTDPEFLKEARRFVNKLDPYRPVTVVFIPGDALPRYLGAFDIVMIDPYPIPHGDVTVVSDSVDAAFEIAGADMPNWTVPQAFSGGEWWKREPTPQEEIAMTYLSLLHGSRGIQYFIRRDPIANPKSPVAWGACRQAAMEASQLVPAFFSLEEAPAVNCSPDFIQSRAYLDRGILTVIAVNTKNKPVMYQVKIDGSNYSGQADVPFELRQVEVKNGVIAEPIEGHGRRVYQIAIGPMPKEDLKINPNNLMVNSSWENMVSPGTPANCYIWTGPSEAFQWVGTDRGATALIDPLEARHGRRSLKLSTPTKGKGISVCSFWVSVEKGKKYRYSIWAKADRGGTEFGIETQGMNLKPRRFILTRDWKKFEITWTAAESSDRVSMDIRHIGPGTAWFDLMQIVPIEKP